MSVYVCVFMFASLTLVCVKVRDGYREPVFFWTGIRNWVNTGLPVSFRTNGTVIDTCVVLSPYTLMLKTN